MRNVILVDSPHDGFWYYQQTFGDWKVSKKEYPTKEEALRDYHMTDHPDYEWED